MRPQSVNWHWYA